MSSEKPKRSRSRKLFYYSLVLLAFLLVVEVVLRGFGFKAGFVGASPWEVLPMQPVDELVLTPEYYVDEEGLYRANPELISPTYAVLNEHGFRSVPFERDSSDRTSILFLGDSFAWGASAEPLTESFVDRLNNDNDLICFNAGIPGAGPEHYLRNSEVFIPLLQPDIVAVAFYMGNDIYYDYREVEANQSPYHITNAGWIDRYIDGLEFDNPQEAYDYYIRRFSIPFTDSNAFNWICSKTAIGTRIWHLMSWVEWVKRYDEEVQANIDNWEASKSPLPVNYEYFDYIQQNAERNGAEFYLFVIQVHSHLAEDPGDNELDLFRGHDYHFCPDLRRSDYHEWPNGHFTNSGHEVFANYIWKTMELPRQKSK